MPPIRLGLTFNIDQFGQDFVTGGNDARVGLKCPLGGNHFDKFLGQVDIGHLDGAGADTAQPAALGNPYHGLAGIPRLGIQVFAHFVDAVIIGEIRQHHLIQWCQLPIGIAAGHDPGFINRNPPQHPDVYPFWVWKVVIKGAAYWVRSPFVTTGGV